MKMLDALACGLPAITPLFGGPTDFCTPGELLSGRLHARRRSATASIRDRFASPTGRSGPSRIPTASSRRCERSSAIRRRRARFGRASAVATSSRASPGQTRAEQLVELPGRRVESAEDHSRRRPRQGAGATGRALTLLDGPADQRRHPDLQPEGHRCSKCLRALEQQSILPQEFEVIVVDDGSSDGTRETARVGAVRIRAEVLPPGQPGTGTARNHGVQPRGRRARPVHRR